MSPENDFDKVEELVGGLTNALNRGEPINIAQRTFLNAGYSPQAVDMAVKTVMGSNVEVLENEETTPQVPINPPEIKIPPQRINLHAQNSPVPTPRLVEPQPKQAEMQQPPQGKPRPNQGRSPSKISYIVIILLLLFSLGIIIGAGILGLYWNQIFT